MYSSKVRAGKRRTYFFDVRRTKGDDFYITLTESTKRFNSDGYERHKIFLYKEDFNRFFDALGDCINHVKTELIPDYDYDEFTRRQQEWEEQQKLEAAQQQEQSENHEPEETETSETPESQDAQADVAEEVKSDAVENSPPPEAQEKKTTEVTKDAQGEVEEDDMTW